MSPAVTAVNDTNFLPGKEKDKMRRGDE